jgi:ribose transport system substrate-binding protein
VHCAEIIAAGTNRYPDLAAWIAVGGWPVFTKNALAAVPAHTKVISFDTIPPAPDLLKAGKVQVLLGQKYFGWGSESVRLLADIKAGKMPANPIIDSGVDVVTAANVISKRCDRLEGARETIAAGVSHAPGGSSGTGIR